MQERHSLFSGAHSALPPGPGLITGKTRLGVLLLTSFLACGGIASLFSTHPATEERIARLQGDITTP